MTATYFLSDPHLDHKNICNFRTCFSSVEENNEVIIQNYQSVVRPNDTVWFLGDVAFSYKALQELKKMNGKKRIILGNHDGSSEPKKVGYTLADMLEVFEEVHGFTRQYGFWLSHCPISEIELRGRVNIHGHVHSQTLQSSNYLNVSVENIGYKPITLDRLRFCAENKIIHNLNDF